jgi:hypothetical protein
MQASLFGWLLGWPQLNVFYLCSRASQKPSFVYNVYELLVLCHLGYKRQKAYLTCIAKVRRAAFLKSLFFKTLWLGRLRLKIYVPEPAINIKLCNAASCSHKVSISKNHFSNNCFVDDVCHPKVLTVQSVRRGICLQR